MIDTEKKLGLAYVRFRPLKNYNHTSSLMLSVNRKALIIYQGQYHLILLGDPGARASGRAL